MSRPISQNYYPQCNPAWLNWYLLTPPLLDLWVTQTSSSCECLELLLPSRHPCVIPLAWNTFPLLLTWLTPAQSSSPSEMSLPALSALSRQARFLYLSCSWIPRFPFRAFVDICGHVFVCMFISLMSVSPARRWPLSGQRCCFVHCSSPRNQHRAWHTADLQKTWVIEQRNEWRSAISASS